MVRSYLKYEAAHTGGVLVSPLCNSAVTINPSLAMPSYTSASASNPTRSKKRNSAIVVVAALRSLHYIDVRLGESVYSVSVLHDSDEGTLTTLAVLQGGTYLACGTSEGRVYLLQYDAESRTMVESFATAAHKYHTRVNHISFSEDGAFMFSGGQDTHIVVWDVIGKEPVTRLQGHHGPITGLHGTGPETLLSTSADGLIKIWDLAQQICIQTLVVCDVASMVTSSAYSGMNQKVLLIGTRDESIRCYGVKEQGRELLALPSILRKSKKAVSAIHFTNGSSTVYVQSNERCVEVLLPMAANKKNKKRAKEETTSGLRYASIFYSKDAKIAAMVALPEQQVLLCLADNSVQVHQVMADPDFEKDAQTAASPEPRVLALYGHQGPITACHVTHDNTGLLTMSPSDGLRTWRFDFDTNRIVCSGAIVVEASSSPLSCVGVLSQGVHAVAGSEDGTVTHFYMPELSARHTTSVAHEGGVTCLFVVPGGGDEGKSFYTGGKDKTLKLWKFDKAWRLREVTERRFELDDVPVAITVDVQRRFVAVALQDTTIKVLHSDTHRQFLNLYGHKYAVTSLSISDDCEMLASGSADKNIKLWGLDFGDLHRSIIAHDDYVLTVSFIPSTHYIASGGRDGTVKLWDGDSWSLIQQLPNSTGAVQCVSVAPDGAFFAVCGADRHLQAYARTEELLFPQEETQRLMERAIDKELQERGAFESIKNSSGSGLPAAHRTTSAIQAAERLLDVLESMELGRAKPMLLWSVLRDEVRPTDMHHALQGLPSHDAMRILSTLTGLFDEGLIDSADVVAGVVTRLCRTHYESIPRHMLNGLLARLRAFAAIERERLGHNLAGLSFLQQNWELRAASGFEDVT